MNLRDEELWKLAHFFSDHRRPDQRDSYPPYWDRLASSIKMMADWKCEVCRHPHEPEEGYCLTVHHLVAVKSMCYRWNLAALCQRCHLKLEGRLSLEREADTVQMFALPEWLVPHLEGFIEWRKQNGSGREAQAL